MYSLTNCLLILMFLIKTEKELCQLTRQFEDFVVQFLDRCFALVENCSLEQVTGLDRTLSNNHKNTHESLMGTSVSGALQGTLTQCSPQIFQVLNNILVTYNKKFNNKVCFCHQNIFIIFNRLKIF